MRAGVSNRGEVAELQGLYGPYAVNEKLVQKIWLRREFKLEEARTTEGELVEVLSPGRWNLLEGPDFREARLRIGGRDVCGDVEVHFKAESWAAHRHDADPEYDGVVLHVLLFPPKPGRPADRTRGGRKLPVLVLLDLLYHDLEEYAADDALETAMESSHWAVTEELLKRPMEDRVSVLREAARQRWRLKTHFAKIRLEKLGWEEACHQTAMEILGYGRNRVPMLWLAGMHPFAVLRNGGGGAEELFRAVGERWRLSGVRPSNHPLHRLEQYLAWLRECGDWPRRLRAAAEALPEFPADEPQRVDRFRKDYRVNSLRRDWAGRLTGGHLGGTRLDTMICDGFLPLGAAETGRDLFSLWFAWPAGDFPDRVTATLRTAEIDRKIGMPFCNGLGQGVLGFALATPVANG